jgi:hypothetical protein
LNSRCNLGRGRHARGHEHALWCAGRLRCRADGCRRCWARGTAHSRSRFRQNGRRRSAGKCRIGCRRQIMWRSCGPRGGCRCAGFWHDWVGRRKNRHRHNFWIYAEHASIMLAGECGLDIGRWDQRDCANLPSVIVCAQLAQQVMLVERAVRHQHIQHQLANQACPDHRQQYCRADQDQELPRATPRSQGWRYCSAGLHARSEE